MYFPIGYLRCTVVDTLDKKSSLSKSWAALVEFWDEYIISVDFIPLIKISLNIFYFCSCSYIRANLKQLIRNLNCQKNAIKKKHGIVVDGKKYNISFTGK